MTGVSSTTGMAATPAPARGGQFESRPETGRDFDDVLAAQGSRTDAGNEGRTARADRARADRVHRDRDHREADRPDRVQSRDRRTVSDRPDNTDPSESTGPAESTGATSTATSTAATAAAADAAARAAQDAQPVQVPAVTVAVQPVQASAPAAAGPGEGDGVQAVGAAGSVPAGGPGQPLLTDPAAGPASPAVQGAATGPGTSGVPVPDPTAQTQTAGQTGAALQALASAQSTQTIQTAAQSAQAGQAGQAAQAGQASQVGRSTQVGPAPQGTGPVADQNGGGASRRVDASAGTADQVAAVPLLPPGDRLAVDLANVNAVTAQPVTNAGPDQSQLADAAASLRAGVPGTAQGDGQAAPGSGDPKPGVSAADSVSAGATVQGAAATVAAQQTGQTGTQISTVPAQAMTVSATAPQPRQPVSDQVAQQLNKHITGVRRLSDGTHSTIIRLSPEQLGDVTVKLDVRGGDVHVEMIAGPQALGALQNDLNNLRDQLAQSGLDLGDVSFSQPDGSGQQQAARDAQDARATQDGRRGDGGARNSGPRSAEPPAAIPHTGVMTADGRIDVRV